jgi:hypothetical protein
LPRRRCPARGGGTLVGATLELIAADPTALLVDYGFVPLIFTPRPASIADVDAAATEAERLLAAPTTLLVYDPVTDEMLNWTPERSIVGEWITAARRDPGSDCVGSGADRAFGRRLV